MAMSARVVRLQNEGMMDSMAQVSWDEWAKDAVGQRLGPRSYAGRALTVGIAFGAHRVVGKGTGRNTGVASGAFRDETGQEACPTC
jgi:hypothetical protein